MRRPLQGVTRQNLGKELLAGATLLAIAVPLNIGYAQIAGLSPSAGLYALIVPTIVYAVLVSSRQVVASPDAAAAALVFSSLTALHVAGEHFAAMAASRLNTPLKLTVLRDGQTLTLTIPLASPEDEAPAAPRN